jgi:transposase-like protein
LALIVSQHALSALLAKRANSGQKEIIRARLADSENEKDCTSSGGPGMLAALRQIYPYQKKQRCVFHKLRNVAAKLPMKFKEACMQGARLIFAGGSRTEAIRRFNDWKAQWAVLAEGAVRCMEKDLYECLTYYDFEKTSGRRTARRT